MTRPHLILKGPKSSKKPWIAVQKQALSADESIEVRVYILCVFKVLVYILKKKQARRDEDLARRRSNVLLIKPKVY